MDDWRGLSEKGELLYILVAGEGLAFSLESSGNLLDRIPFAPDAAKLDTVLALI